MNRFAAKTLLLVIFTLCFTLSSQAWDEVGHKITAYIAWQRMTPEVRERVIKILLTAPEDAQLSTFYASYGSRTQETRQREFFMLVATWADIIRDRNFKTRFEKYAHSNWHYSDTMWQVENGKVLELTMAPESGGQAVPKLVEFDKLVRDPAVPDAQKAIAIAWLEHLIGDVHQPLHASARVTDLEPKGDAGANTFLLTPRDTPREKQENLHWFWDSIIGRAMPNTKDQCEADYIDPIASDIIKDYPFAKLQSRLDLGDFDRWRKESFEIASTKVFPADLKRFEFPSDKYKKEALKISEERLALAGYRMGELFNQVFAVPSNSRADQMTPQEILSFFEGRQAAIVGSIREIVDVESPSFDQERSKEVVSLIENKFRELPVDLTVERVVADGVGEHLIIKAFPSPEKHIFFLGHTDTVHPVGTKLENPTRIEGDKFYGCGIFDMKANIALMLECLRYLAQTGINPSRPITILLSCDEEVGSFTGRPLVEREAANAEACLVFEPSFDGAVKTGHKGTGMYTLHAHGIPAHAGLEPENGASAILELSRQIEKLHHLNDPNSGTTVNACTIKGGTTMNVIPEHAECSIDVRFSSTVEAERVDSSIRSLSSVDPRVTLEVRGGINRPPMERTAAVTALYEKARDLASSFDYTLGETQVGGASDGNFVAALGVPVLDGLGIAGAGAHTLHEHIRVSDIAQRGSLIALLLMT